MNKEMNFHGFGTVSKETMVVIYENKEVIMLGDSEDIISDEDFLELNKEKHEFSSGDEYWIFNKETGECLNDNNGFGCYRTI